MILLEVRNLWKIYGKTEVLKGLNMNVPKGAVYGLVGRNGAGKTTLLRQICALQKPSDGSIIWESSDLKVKDAAIRKIGAIIETPALYLDMTAKENIEMVSRIRGGITEFQKLECLEIVGLTDTGKKKVKDFSLGMRQRLGISVAIVGGIDLLVLDEPTNGLDPQGIEDLKELIVRLNDNMGLTIIVSSHAILELSQIATHFGIMDNGKMIREIEKSQLNDIDLKNYYFSLLEEQR